MPFRKDRISNISQHTQNGVMFEWCDVEDQCQKQFFLNHYMNILRAKKINFDNRNDPVEHILTGKKFLCDGRELYIQSVHKHWFMGYYYVLLYYSIMENGNHSHGTLSYENISCHYPDILDEIEENRNKITLL